MSDGRRCVCAHQLGEHDEQGCSVCRAVKRRPCERFRPVTAEIPDPAGLGL